MRLARTPGPCAWGFGVLGLLGGSALAAPTPSTSLETTVEVRVNDQRSKRLLEPWITVELESGEMVAARALDDGVDPGDRFANDRIYIARLHFAGAGRGRLYLTNGEKQPGTDLWLASRAVEAVRGRAVTVELADPAGSVTALPSRRVRAPQEPGPGGPEGGQPSGPPPGGVPGGAPGGDGDADSPVAREALIRPSFVPLADWPWAWIGALIAGPLGLWWVDRRLQRLGRLLVGRLLRLGDQLRGMANAPRPRRTLSAPARVPSGAQPDPR